MPLDYNYTGTEQSLSISEVDGLQTDLDLKAPIASPTFTGTVSGITKSMVGLSAVDNTSDADKPISDTTLQALNLKAPIESPTFTGTVAGITKAMVGLSAVDNTSDADKPVSTAGQSALDLKSNLASPTFSGTVKIEKADNYGQIELTDLKSVAVGVGGGITMKGVYGGSGQTTGLAHIKSQKSNSTVGDYHGDLSLSVREHGGGGYTEIIKLKGEDLKTIVSGSMEVAGNINLPTGSEFQINGTAIGGGGGGGVCLESIGVIPTGQSITTESGQSLTFPNIVATTALPTRPSFLNIGEFDYLPPTGTKMVILSYKLMLPYQGSFSQFLIFNCSQNATEITHTQVSFENGGGESPCYTIEVIINIDSAFGSDDIANGKLASWTTPKTFIFQGQKWFPTFAANIHGKYGYANQNLSFAPPTMKIEAFS